MFVSLALLGYAGADENNLQVWVVAAQHFGVRHHGRVDRGQIGQSFGIVHLYQATGCRTSRRDKVAHFAFGQHSFVLFGDGLCADGRLFGYGKTKFGKRYA